jgi:glycosyltransferase involved in cell wall biosynthesis
MCECNGLDILVDAFILLSQEPGFEDVGLVLTGGSTGDDRPFLSGIRKKLKEKGLHHRVEIHDDFEEEGLRDYFKKVSVVSVPVHKGEAFGIYLLESMASGVPVIQPALGAFPEIVKLTGGGELFEPNTPERLAESLKKVLGDSDLLDHLSQEGRKGVEEHFHLRRQAGKMLAVYEAAIAENLKKEKVTP